MIDNEAFDSALQEIQALQKRVLELELDKRALEEELAELKRRLVDKK